MSNGTFSETWADISLCVCLHIVYPTRIYMWIYSYIACLHMNRVWDDPKVKPDSIHSRNGEESLVTANYYYYFFFCQCYPLKITFIVTEDFLFMMGRFFLGSLLKPRIPNIVFEHNLSGLTSDCKTSSLALLRQMSSALSASGDCDD